MAKYEIHPEVLDAVNAEFSRLHLKHPTTDTKTKVDVAKRFVRALALADTSMFLRAIEVETDGAH